MIRTFDHADFTPEAVAARKDGAVTVVLPARNEAATIGEIVTQLRSLDGLIDQLLVIDASSPDGTADAARAAGAEVFDESELVPEAGPAQGKGDAMWRALAVARGDYIAYIDADTIGFSPHFAVGLLGALVGRDDVRFVKGVFSRPFLANGREMPREGGRVTELCARPLLSAFYPSLAHFGQPLAGEVAARRDLLEEIPFCTGYDIEIGMLIDVYERFGIDCMAQVDLGERQNQHQALVDLGPMAYAILGAVLRRLRASGRFTDTGPLPAFRGPDGGLREVEREERPPFASVRSRA